MPLYVAINIIIIDIIIILIIVIVIVWQTQIHVDKESRLRCDIYAVTDSFYYYAYNVPCSHILCKYLAFSFPFSFAYSVFGSVIKETIPLCMYTK